MDCRYSNAQSCDVVICEQLVVLYEDPISVRMRNGGMGTERNERERERREKALEEGKKRSVEQGRK